MDPSGALGMLKAAPAASLEKCGSVLTFGRLLVPSGGDGLASPLSTCVCFAGTYGGVLIKCGTHWHPGADLEGSRSCKRITAAVSPNASRGSHTKRALMYLNPATICQERPRDGPGTLQPRPGAHEMHRAQ